MTENALFVAIFLPIVAGLLALLFRRGAGVSPAYSVPSHQTEGETPSGHAGETPAPHQAAAVLALLATAVNLAVAIWLFGREATVVAPWAGGALEFALRLYHFSGFILLAAAGFAFLVTLYSMAFMKGRPYAGQFFSYLLLSVGLVNGAVLADNLVLLLFFWEGLLVTLFGMIAIGRPGAFKTAIKALVIVGVSDLCMMLGIAMTGYLAHQAGESRFLCLSAIAPLNLSATGAGGVAMIMLMIGAISKAGSMPFHSWIPDAALDAPLPFMAFLPASLEKLLGIYFLARISLDLYHIPVGSWTSMVMMTIGAITILLAVMMALVQKDYKRLLSYHAISQVGYMILGLGTALPVGIVGGLFHMINHAMYKSCLFLTGGAVERQTGTTALAKLGGIARNMPITFTCFFVAAAAISGCPPLNGFYSKELVYDAAMQRSIFFYLAAILGTFFTAASFLKLGHSAYFGKRADSDTVADAAAVKEAPWSMLLPMLVIAAGCVVFGVYNALPLNGLIQPIVKDMLHGESFAGLVPHQGLLVAMTMVALAGAVFNHILGAKVNGGPLHAVDHIYHAPVLGTMYDKAERRAFDPYDLVLKLVGPFAQLGWWVDRSIDWIYDGACVTMGRLAAALIYRVHNGSYAMYVMWSLAAAAAIIVFLTR